MNHPSKKLKVIAVDENGVITAFVKELPGLVVQGNSKEDIANKIGMLIDTFIKRLQASKDNLEIETTSIA